MSEPDSATAEPALLAVDGAIATITLNRPNAFNSINLAIAKRLEQGRLIANWNAVTTREMDWTGLKLLLEGIEPKRVRLRYKETSFPTEKACTA